MDALVERVAVKEGQLLLGAKPHRPVMEFALNTSYGVLSNAGDFDPLRVGAKIFRVEWQKNVQEIPTGNPDPSQRAVYVTWFTPKILGMR